MKKYDVFAQKYQKKNLSVNLASRSNKSHVISMSLRRGGLNVIF